MLYIYVYFVLFHICCSFFLIHCLSLYALYCSSRYKIYNFLINVHRMFSVSEQYSTFLRFVNPFYYVHFSSFQLFTCYAFFCLLLLYVTLNNSVHKKYFVFPLPFSFPISLFVTFHVFPFFLLLFLFSCPHFPCPFLKGEVGTVRQCSSAMLVCYSYTKNCRCSVCY